jgi:branched-chain amino acid transport system substrate-binding protein
VDAMVVVEGLNRAGKDVTRENFITAIESIHEMNVELGSELKLTYGPADHKGKGFDNVYPTIVQKGRAHVADRWVSDRQSSDAGQPTLLIAVLAIDAHVRSLVL